jgi:hypothetical protein
VEKSFRLLASPCRRRLVKREPPTPFLMQYGL